jgi:hypothetical protein
MTPTQYESERGDDPLIYSESIFLHTWHIDWKNNVLGDLDVVSKKGYSKKSGTP